jgi:hypothetical protein
MRNFVQNETVRLDKQKEARQNQAPLGSFNYVVLGHENIPQN